MDTESQSEDFALSRRLLRKLTACYISNEDDRQWLNDFAHRIDRSGWSLTLQQKEVSVVEFVSVFAF